MEHLQPIRKVSKIEAEIILQNHFRKAVKKYTSQFTSSELKEYYTLLLEDDMQAAEYLESIDLVPVSELPKMVKPFLQQMNLDYADFEEVFIRSFDKSSLKRPLEPNKQLLILLADLYSVHSYFQDKREESV